MFVPLSALPYRTALLAWFLFNVVLTSGALVLLCRMLPAGSTWQTWGLVPLLTVCSFPFVQATTGLLLPVTIAAAIALHAPIELGLLSFVPLVPLIAILAVEIAGLDSLRSEFGLKVRLIDHLRLVLSAVPYQLLLSVAAARAAWRELRGQNDWEKTVHVGAHL